MPADRPISAKFVLSLVLAGLAVLFLIQNVGVFEIRFLFWSFYMPRSLLLIIVLAIGVIVGWFWHSVSVHRKNRLGSAPRDV